MASESTPLIQSTIPTDSIMESEITPLEKPQDSLESLQEDAASLQREANFLRPEDAINGMEKLRRKVRNSIAQHRLAKQHFSTRQFKRFFLPQSLITLTSSILSFVANSLSGEDNENWSWMTLTVGILSLVVVTFQIIDRECSYGERAVMHDTAIEGLRYLELELDSALTIYKMSSGPKNLKELNKELVTRQKQYMQFEIGCKSSIPPPLREAFNLMESEVKRSSDKSTTTLGVTFDDFHKTAFEQLYQVIVIQRSFPMHLPNAIRANHDARLGLEYLEEVAVDKLKKATTYEAQMIKSRKLQRLQKLADSIEKKKNDDEEERVMWKLAKVQRERKEEEEETAKKRQKLRELIRLREEVLWKEQEEKIRDGQITIEDIEQVFRTQKEEDKSEIDEEIAEVTNFHRRIVEQMKKAAESAESEEQIVGMFDV